MSLIKKSDLSENHTTDYETYKNRRHFLKTAAGLGAIAASGVAIKPLLSQSSTSTFSTQEAKTPFKDITSYCNFYEFGTKKTDPSEHAHTMITDDWTVEIDGECEKLGTLNLEDILKSVTLEERIYRMRCVEGWSMVIPWIGFPVSALLKQAQPTSKAKYVQFDTLYDPDNMRGQQANYLANYLEWPYTEGLRIDEAMHPLTILSTGLYGKDLLNQNGAPLRLVVPWKYGFKSIKSIVRI
ncbi:UNVERIFIED_CONTAM: hypothetical protein GTU68_053468, partial [Idotea baltica]|nr:hypothetical protein [Idotea baltica]